MAADRPNLASLNVNACMASSVRRLHPPRCRPSHCLVGRTKGPWRAFIPLALLAFHRNLHPDHFLSSFPRLWFGDFLRVSYLYFTCTTSLSLSSLSLSLRTRSWLHVVSHGFGTISFRYVRLKRNKWFLFVRALHVHSRLCFLRCFRHTGKPRLTQAFICDGSWPAVTRPSIPPLSACCLLRTSLSVYLNK